MLLEVHPGAEVDRVEIFDVYALDVGSEVLPGPVQLHAAVFAHPADSDAVALGVSPTIVSTAVSVNRRLSVCVVRCNRYRSRL